MEKTIDKIFLSAEKISSEHSDFKNSHTDVIVRFEDGEEYAASFFTFGDVEKQRLQQQAKGENMGGKFFWVNQMFLIDDCSRENVERVVKYLMEEGEFLGVFGRV